ncbi:hypothetical protein PanWU01x14_286770 [Parasponia andersonii]|uniref:Uncharacterized protein n=1 Tax=Parasponia andersonii TaxID=3476 RepID=A0A2P5AYZ5_PARAD|nr:hypothetical protein PanWU01x14_286770 [Parasponia andersonii]
MVQFELHFYLLALCDSYMHVVSLHLINFLILSHSFCHLCLSNSDMHVVSLHLINFLILSHSFCHLCLSNSDVIHRRHLFLHPELLINITLIKLSCPHHQDKRNESTKKRNDCDNNKRQSKALST